MLLVLLPTKRKMKKHLGLGREEEHSETSRCQGNNRRRHNRP
jgi:hypothetical protein